MDIISSNEDMDLEKLAVEVFKGYPEVPEGISVFQSGTVKTVWKVKSKGEMLCLKRLKQSYEKALFSVYAQDFIHKSGGNVPAIIKDKDGRLIYEYNNQLFVLYKWIHGKDLNFANSSDLTSAIQGLAKFHLASKGYVPPQGARISSKLGKWPEQYNSMKSRMLEWKVLSKKTELPYHKAYLNNVDSIIDLANTALHYIKASSYEKLTSPDSPLAVLCHQDYGKGNAIMTEKGVYVIDLDGVTFDLPARDLRKIIGKQAEIKGQWSKEIISENINRYIKINSLVENENELLYIDLLFPHWFFGLVKNLFQNNKPLKPSEIERLAKLEASKAQFIKQLLLQSK